MILEGSRKGGGGRMMKGLEGSFGDKEKMGGEKGIESSRLLEKVGGS